MLKRLKSFQCIQMRLLLLNRIEPNLGKAEKKTESVNQRVTEPLSPEAIAQIGALVKKVGSS